MKRYHISIIFIFFSIVLLISGYNKFGNSSIDGAKPVGAEEVVDPCDYNRVIHQLQELGFRGKIIATLEDRKQMAQDYGNRVKKIPPLSLAPVSALDVSIVVTAARTQKCQIVTRGTGHALDGQSQSDKAIILITRDLLLPSGKTVEVLTRAGRKVARLSSGQKWYDAVTKLYDYGLRPVVFLEIPGLSVGGTLSVGGIGYGSHQFGLQIDTVTQLTAVDGLGKIRDCAPKGYNKEASMDDRFCESLLGGQGQFGVITSAEIEVTSAKPYIHVKKEVEPDLDHFLDKMESAASNWNVFELFGYITYDQVPRYVVSVGITSDSPTPTDPLDTVSPFLLYVKKLEYATAVDYNSSGRTPYFPAWLNLLVSDRVKFSAIFRSNPELMKTLQGNDFFMIVPIKGPRLHHDSLLQSVTENPGTGTFVIHLDQIRSVFNTSEELRKRNAKLLEVFVAPPFDGRRYWIDDLPRVPKLWELNFGAYYDRVRANKIASDPDMVFRPFPFLFTPN